eukprot:15339659-Ditylum_brightwellii.AAC.1
MGSSNDNWVLEEVQRGRGEYTILSDRAAFVHKDYITSHLSAVRTEEDSKAFTKATSALFLKSALKGVHRNPSAAEDVQYPTLRSFSRSIVEGRKKLIHLENTQFAEERIWDTGKGVQPNLYLAAMISTFRGVGEEAAMGGEDQCCTDLDLHASMVALGSNAITFSDTEKTVE